MKDLRDFIRMKMIEMRFSAVEHEIADDTNLLCFDVPEVMVAKLLIEIADKFGVPIEQFCLAEYEDMTISGIYKLISNIKG